MTINERILAALSPLGCPVGFMVLDETTSFPCISFQCYLEQGEYYADDVEYARSFYVQIDVWSKTDYMALVTSVQDAMSAADFGLGTAQDLYEADTGIYHKLMRFTYTEFK